MASVKVKFRASSVADREGRLFYQIIHNRIIRQISTDYRIFSSEWDNNSGMIILYPEGVGTERASIVLSIQERIRWDKVRLNKIIESLDNQESGYTADDVVQQFNDRAKEQSFFDFMLNVIVGLRRLGKVRTSETYTAALKSFMRFRNERDVMLEEIDSEMMMLYEAWLKERDISMNTISFYMRILQATYNRAIEKELTVQRYPFKHVYTGVEKTVKRAVPFKYIKKIKDLELPAGSSIDFARDMFLFSFYTRGMSFVDIAYLKKADLKSGVLTYRRQKTGRRLSIKWEKPMQEIVDKYNTNGTPYLLPIIRDMNADIRRQYKNAAHLVNDKLKKLGEKLGLTVPLTSYVARHGWASIARSRNIPLAIISEAMGHDSEKTTRIYLASLDTTSVDKANSRILKAL